MTEREWPIARLADIAEPGAQEFRVGAGDWPFRIIVVRWQGEVHAYANTCPHLGHPLNIDPGRFFTPDNSHLICSSHGAVFEPDTGLCTLGPCVGAALRCLPCRVDDDLVLVTAPDSLRDI